LRRDDRLAASPLRVLGPCCWAGRAFGGEGDDYYYYEPAKALPVIASEAKQSRVCGVDSGYVLI
jgi:hypothetical protein